MLRKEITYTDFEGVQQTKTFFFNLSRSELAKLELGSQGKGGLQASLQAIIDAGDNQRILEEFEKIVRMTYGIKTPDGDFVKTKEVQDIFISGPAYDQMFIDFLTDPNAFSAFINAVVPADPADFKNSQTQPAPSAREQFAQRTGRDIPEGTVDVNTTLPSDAHRIPMAQDSAPVQVPTTPQPQPTQVPPVVDFRQPENAEAQPSGPQNPADYAAFLRWQEQQAQGNLPRPPHEQ